MARAIRGAAAAFVILTLCVGAGGGPMALAQEPEPLFAYTHCQPVGNRYAPDRKAMPFAIPLAP